MWVVEAWVWLQWWRWWRSKGRSRRCEGGGRRHEGSPVVWLAAMLVTEGAARGGDDGGLDGGSNAWSRRRWR